MGWGIWWLGHPHKVGNGTTRSHVWTFWWTIGFLRSAKHVTTVDHFSFTPFGLFRIIKQREAFFSFVEHMIIIVYQLSKLTWFWNLPIWMTKPTNKDLYSDQVDFATLCYNLHTRGYLRNWQLPWLYLHWYHRISCNFDYYSLLASYLWLTF